MGDITVDATTKVQFCTSVADITAPTEAEIGAGISLEGTMTPDGLMGFEASTTAVDNSSLKSRFNTTRPGRTSFTDTALQFKKQDGTDTIWNTLVRDTEGFIIVRRYVDADTDFAADDKVSVFPIACGDTIDITPAANEVAKWKVQTFITEEPELRAVVAA